MLTPRQAIATNRFGLGARPDDGNRIASPEEWLLAQIEPGAAATPGERPESAVTLEELARQRLAREAARSRLTNQPPEVDPEAIREYARFVASSYQTQAATGFAAAIDSDQPFRERLVRFWANHFAVSADKQPVGAIAGHFRDEAIRPHVTGNFASLLKAAVQHPAMLLYLDNQTSIGPHSVLGTRANRNRQVGLNENLAREILELHTLGVDGGYTQDDVIEFAKCLTGWSIGGQAEGVGPGLAAMLRRLGGADPGPPGEFDFRAALHEPGAKTILGHRFAEGGVDEGEAVLEFLAQQPVTARFLATKLARHFVADTPPPALVDRLAASYLEHAGELGPVYRELVAAPASWQAATTKFKTPEEFLISACRAVGTPLRGNQLVTLATQLGQRPLTPGSPAGWPDIAEHWNGGDALLKRIEIATTLGGRIGDRIDAVERLDAILGELANDATRTAIRSAESGAQAIALLFSSPEFQWR